jgi:transcriptional regulator with XRE-family HTH domain
MQKNSDDLDLYKYIGSRIKQKRKELKLSQSKVAEALSVEYIQIQRYEKGVTRIPLENLLKLSKFFNVSPEYFYDYSEEKKSINKYSVVKHSENPELEKEIMMLKEIYNYNDENLILIAKSNIEMAYGLLKKERRTGKIKRITKKKVG